MALNIKVSHLEKPYMSLFLVLLFYLTFIIKFEATFNNFYEKSEKFQNFTVFLPLGNFFPKYLIRQPIYTLMLLHLIIALCI